MCSSVAPVAVTVLVLEVLQLGGTTVSSFLTLDARGRSGEGQGWDFYLALEAGIEPIQHLPRSTAS